VTTLSLAIFPRSDCDRPPGLAAWARRGAAVISAAHGDRARAAGRLCPSYPARPPSAPPSLFPASVPISPETFHEAGPASDVWRLILRRPRRSPAPVSRPPNVFLRRCKVFGRRRTARARVGWRPSMVPQRRVHGVSTDSSRILPDGWNERHLSFFLLLSAASPSVWAIAVGPHPLPRAAAPSDALSIMLSRARFRMKVQRGLATTSAKAGSNRINRASTNVSFLDSVFAPVAASQPSRLFGESSPACQAPGLGAARFVMPDHACSSILSSRMGGAPP